MGKYKSKHEKHIGKDERFLYVCNWNLGGNEREQGDPTFVQQIKSQVHEPL